MGFLWLFVSFIFTLFPQLNSKQYLFYLCTKISSRSSHSNTGDHSSHFADSGHSKNVLSKPEIMVLSKAGQQQSTTARSHGLAGRKYHSTPDMKKPLQFSLPTGSTSRDVKPKKRYGIFFSFSIHVKQKISKSISYIIEY